MFHSEADFQHALAWQIHEAAPESQVRLEVSVIPVEAQRMFLDIWLPVEGIAIELKYKTRGLELEQDDESFALRNQSAQDQGRHDFLLKEGTIPERKALIRNFVEGIEVVGDEATLTYTVPMPSDGVTSESASVHHCLQSGTVSNHRAGRPPGRNAGRQLVPAAGRGTGCLLAAIAERGNRQFTEGARNLEMWLVLADGDAPPSKNSSTRPESGVPPTDSSADG